MNENGARCEKHGFLECDWCVCGANAGAPSSWAMVRGRPCQVRELDAGLPPEPDQRATTALHLLAGSQRRGRCLILLAFCRFLFFRSHRRGFLHSLLTSVFCHRTLLSGVGAPSFRSGHAPKPDHSSSVCASRVRAGEAFPPAKRQKRGRKHVRDEWGVKRVLISRSGFLGTHRASCVKYAVGLKPSN